ncbi:hypothetical protein [Spirosoma flavum]|uniref:Uncharacterized protein n=1 Tax=Spirosoma flavum TaxID=2048557 RepID=A0ABW6ATI8_9BACT
MDMGVIKDVWDIFWDSVNLILGLPKRQKRHLSVALNDIATLLDNIREKFKGRVVPRREAYELIGIINVADKLAQPFKEKYPELAQVFDLQLPMIGKMMRDVDFFIDEKPRYSLHSSYDTKDAQFPAYVKGKIDEACEELERAAGIISSHSKRFKLEGKKLNS